MSNEREWPEVERRREINVTVAHLSNGVKKAAWTALGLLATGVLWAIGWGIRTEIRDHRQDTEIAANATADRVIDEALAEAVSEINTTIRDVIDEQKALRQEMDQNRNGLGILDAESNAIRRDFEREHGRRP